MRLSKIGQSLLVVCVLGINPGLACSSSSTDTPSEFDYGKGEMAAVSQGKWKLSIQRPDGIEDVFFELMLAAIPGKSSLAACGNRDFFQSAGACVSISTLHLSGQTTKPETGQTQAISGDFRVMGTRFSTGSLSVVFSNALSMSAELGRDASIKEPFVTDSGTRRSGTLQRLNPQ